MIWKKSEADNPPIQTPMQPPPQPLAPRSQPPPAKERALIGPSIEIKGTLSGGEDLFVEGRVEGKIELAQHSGRIDMTSKPAVEAKPLHTDSTAVKPPSQQVLRQDRTGDKD